MNQSEGLLQPLKCFFKNTVLLPEAPKLPEKAYFIKAGFVFIILISSPTLIIPSQPHKTF